ncbi:MAG TPA: tetratricopeptide repeat protein, partial [Calditrichia bacterium]|nr:tetratricopeptide repeat protein [Calditrichia bacterium]
YADALFKLGQFDNARVEFQGLAVGFPENARAPRAWEMVGKSYEKLGKAEEAAKAYETVKILYQNNSLAPAALLSAARLYMSVDQLNRADQSLKEFLDRYLESAEYPQGRILFGQLLMKKGQYEQASREFEKVRGITEEAEDLAAASLGEGQVFQKLGLVNRARERYAEIVEKYGKTAAARDAGLALVQLYQETRDYEAALQLIVRLRERFPEQERYRFDEMAGITHFLKKDYPAAQKAFQSIPAKNLSSRDAFYLAAVQVEQKQYPAARESLEKLEERVRKGELSERYLPAIRQNLVRVALGEKELAQARLALQRFQETVPAEEIGEKLHREVVILAIAQNALSAALDELQRFRGLYPTSIYRDDLVFEIGKAFFNNRQYARSLLFFEQVRDEYPSSASWNPATDHIEFIRNHFNTGEQTGVGELARLFGEMLVGTDRKKLLFDLGRVYLKDLKDFEQAAATFSAVIKDGGDSTTLGKAWYFLSESYLRQEQYQQFTGGNGENSGNRSAEALKKAITFVRFAPFPDTLTFRFLTTTLARDNAGPAKHLEYWGAFETRYPQSALLPKARLAMAATAAEAGDVTRAIAILDRAIASGQSPLAVGNAYWQKAQLQMKGEPEAAIRTLKDFLLNVPSHPRRADGYRTLAEIAAANGQYDQTAGFLKEILERYNYAAAAEGASEMIADAYIRQLDYQAAMTYIEKRLATDRAAGEQDPVLRYYEGESAIPFYFYAGKSAFLQKEYPRARQQLLTYLNRSTEGENAGEALL